MMRSAFLAFALAGTPALADFTENNLLVIFYHELGHAVIDQMQVPIFGQEEDAADALSILLIDALYEPDAAEQMAYDSAALFWVEAAAKPYFWDAHGPDEQRFYNTVCLFYGAEPDAREDFAEELGLPEERAEGCPDEFELVAGSWNTVLNEMNADTSLTGRLVFDGPKAHLLADEIAALNSEFRWPRDIVVRTADCGEANAYYDLSDASVTMCVELTDWLREIEKDLY